MKRRFRWWRYAPLALGLLGCAEALVVGPAPAGAPRAPASTYVPGDYDGSVPYFESETDVPNWGPRVHEIFPEVHWEGRTAVASSSMFYFGNQAEETFSLEISGPSNGSRTASSLSTTGPWPDDFFHYSSDFGYSAGGSCGHTANLSSLHFARISFFVSYRGFAVLEARQPGGKEPAIQPPCPTREEDRPSGRGGGGGGECPECVTEPRGYTTCRYRVTYDLETYDIIDFEILYCL